MTGLGKKMAKGAAWMVLFKFLERSLGLVSTVILARLLVPADFGLIAMATAVLAVIELLGAFNFDIALIQRSNVQRQHYDSAWTLNILFAATIALFTAALAHPAAIFYRDARVESVMYWLALASLIVGFENIGTVAFRKELNFRKEFAFLLTKKVLTIGTTVTLAFVLRTYWALVVGMVTSRALGVGLSYLLHPYRPRFSFACARELLGFSKWLFLNNIVFVALHRGPEFVLGRIVGPTALGVYSLSQEISNLPTTEIAAPINRAVLPGYTKLAEAPDTFRQGFLTVIALIALIGMPAAVGIDAVSGPLVAVMLGEKWVECGPIISILAFYGLITVLQTNFGYVFVAIGKPEIVTRLAFMHAAIMLATVIPSTYVWGARGTAFAVLFSVAAMMPFTYGKVLAFLGLRASDYLRALWRPALSATLMGVCVRLWLYLLDQHEPHYPAAFLLFSSVLLGAIVYVMCATALWYCSGRPDGAEAHVLTVVRGKLRNVVLRLRAARP